MQLVIGVMQVVLGACLLLLSISIGARIANRSRYIDTPLKKKSKNKS